MGNVGKSLVLQLAPIRHQILGELGFCCFDSLGVLCHFLYKSQVFDATGLSQDLQETLLGLNAFFLRYLSSRSLNFK